MSAREGNGKSWTDWKLALIVIALVVATVLTASLAVAAMPTKLNANTGGSSLGGAAPGAKTGSIKASQPLTTCTGWDVVSSPNVVTGTAHYLYGASALATSDVWAVGYFVGPGGFYRSLTQHWNGTDWSTVPAPTQDVGHNALYTVSGVASNDVWAFGDYRNNLNNLFALALHWDGTSWMTSTIPSPGGGFTTIRGSVALAADDMWVVGAYPVGGAMHPLTEHWDGSTWTVVSAAITGTNPVLIGITAFAPDDMWAVGTTCAFFSNCPGGGQPLIEHWDGSTWSISPSPDPGMPRSFLQGISGTATNDIWAVGATCTDTTCSQEQTLTEHWDGSSWSIVPSPVPGSLDSWVGSVVAMAPNDVWATGSASNDGTNYFDPMLHWDGSSWTNITITSPGLVDNDLRALAMVAPNDIWAVGDIDNGTGELTQIQHYTGPCGTPTPTITPTAPPTETPTACAIQFTDVPAGSTFYDNIRCLACRGIINGYPCGDPGEPCDPSNNPYFRPGNNVSRGQLSKIVSNAAGFTDAQPDQLFEDVPVGSTFHDFIGRLATRGYISGYPCGGVGEPCGPNNLPYFRPNSQASRGQISKIDSNAANYLEDPTGQQFEDVQVGSTYYTYTYRLVLHNVMSGYPCGGVGEPCGPTNLPYFRPNANATRGQTSKIVGNTFFPGCVTPNNPEGLKP